MNFLPLWTARVCPTISGTTVERRDQVLMTFLSPPRFIASIFSSSGVSTNGPFFSDRLIALSRGPLAPLLAASLAGPLRPAPLAALVLPHTFRSALDDELVGRFAIAR